jgi:hypothetical protein
MLEEFVLEGARNCEGPQGKGRLERRAALWKRIRRYH